MKRPIFILLCLTLFAVQSAVASEEAGALTIKESKTCINTRLVRGFDALSDKHLYVEERSNKYFLLTLRSRCFNLESAHAIAFTDPMNFVCSKGFGEVSYRDHLSGRFETCHIDTIEAVESKAHAEAIIEAKAGDG